MICRKIADSFEFSVTVNSFLAVMQNCDFTSQLGIHIYLLHKYLLCSVMYKLVQFIVSFYILIECIK